VKPGSIESKFVLHWGEMGTRWGINRTVAQIHALLYLSPEPLHAEEIAETLMVARSNVSTSLRELQSWGIVRNVHVLGDRRDHFESMTEVWEMFERIMDERKRREWEPTLAMLNECLQEAKASKQQNAHLAERLAGLHEFFDTMSSWYAQVRRLPRKTLRSFFKMGSSFKKVLGLS
jgi:DNA-binding transcriptional regulator GbsR (MarR family)